MKIKVSDVDRMIKEEFQKMMEKRKLSSRLSQINEELGKMDSDDSVLNEVEAGGKTHVSSHAWTGKEGGDVKWDAKFEKKGTHLKEDDMPREDDMSGEGDAMGLGMDSEMGAEAAVEENPMGEFEAKFAEIGRAIDAKMNAETTGDMGAEMGAEEEMGAEAGNSDDFEEVEVSDDDDTEVEEVEEYAEVHGGEGAPQGMTAAQALDKPVKESVDEPLEGHSVAQEASVDGVNDNMKKDTHVKESAGKKGTVITEAKKAEGKNIFTEGVDDKKKAKLLEEFNRMKKFAGLSKDEE